MDVEANAPDAATKMEGIETVAFQVITKSGSSHENAMPCLSRRRFEPLEAQ